MSADSIQPSDCGELESHSERTMSTIREFNKSVTKLNQYNDRLILEAEKGCVLTSQLRPSDEKLVIDTTEAAVKFILRYADLLDTIKEVDAKRKTVPDMDYQEFKSKTIATIENLKSDVLKLKLFQEYASRTVESLISSSAEAEEASGYDVSSCNNSYNSFS